MTVSRVLWCMSAITGFVVAVAILYPAERFIPATLVLLVVVLSIVFAPKKLGLLSWSAEIPAFYAVFFLILPLVSRVLGGETESDRLLAEGLYVAALGLFGFMLGTNSGRFIAQPKSAYDMLGLLRMDITRRPRVIWALVLIGGAAQLWSYFFGYFGLITVSGRDAGPAAGFASWAGFLLIIAHAMAWNGYFRQKKLLSIAIVSTALMLALGLFSNSKEKILLPFIIIVLSLWGTSRRFPYKMILGSLLLYVFVIAPFVTFSRFAFVAGEFGTAKTDLAETTVEYLLSGRWGESDSVDSSFVAKYIVGRADLLPYFSDIVHQAGRTVDFMSGKTIFQGIEILVPRIFYPDKPESNVGTWTGQAFGAVPWYNDITAVAPTFARDAVLWLVVLLLVRHFLRRQSHIQIHRIRSAPIVP